MMHIQDLIGAYHHLPSFTYLSWLDLHRNLGEVSQGSPIINCPGSQQIRTQSSGSEYTTPALPPGSPDQWLPLTAPLPVPAWPPSPAPGGEGLLPAYLSLFPLQGMHLSVPLSNTRSAQSLP